MHSCKSEHDAEDHIPEDRHLFTEYDTDGHTGEKMDESTEGIIGVISKDNECPH